MRSVRVAAAAAIAAAALLAGCGQEAAPPPMPLPDEVTYASVGRYCGMTLADHEGPKGQIHLQGQAEPVWFSSVRDTIAFTRLPEEPRDIAAIYVNDMGRARNWAQPEPGTWIDARKAWFVIDSDVRGGMGAPEAVPFSDPAAAQAFQAHRGHGATGRCSPQLRARPGRSCAACTRRIVRECRATLRTLNRGLPCLPADVSSPSWRGAPRSRRSRAWATPRHRLP
jgi:copper chaperone NosL